MSRFFAAPVLATVLALVGIRLAGTPAPRAPEPLDIVVSLPQDEVAARLREAPAAAPAAADPGTSSAPTRRSASA